MVGVAIYPRRPETYIIAGTYKAKNDGNIEPAAIRDRSLCQLPGQCAPAGGVFNAATGPAVAWRVLAETISHTAGANGKTASWTVEEASRIFGPYAKGFTENQQLSAARAHQLLGWSPRGLPILNDLEWGSYRTRVA